MRPEFLPGAAYATLVGVFLGVIQTSYFFSLSIWMTAAYPGFLTVMVGWFAGSVAGLYLARRSPGHGAPSMIDAGLIAASVFSYLASLALLKLSPYETSLLPVHGLFIIISGTQAGWFFGANRRLFGSASRLFFLENNGFVTGWIFGFAGFVWKGSFFIMTAPVMVAAILAAMTLWLAANFGKKTETTPL